MNKVVKHLKLHFSVFSVLSVVKKSYTCQPGSDDITSIHKSQFTNHGTNHKILSDFHSDNSLIQPATK